MGRFLWVWHGFPEGWTPPPRSQASRGLQAVLGTAVSAPDAGRLLASTRLAFRGLCHAPGSWPSQWVGAALLGSPRRVIQPPLPATALGRNSVVINNGHPWHIYVTPKDVALSRRSIFHCSLKSSWKIYRKKITHNPNPRDNSGDLFECPDISGHSFSLRESGYHDSWMLKAPQPYCALRDS